MAETGGNPLTRSVRNFITTLRSSQLVMLAAGIFVLDVLIPDVLPFVDEIVLFVVTLLLARWKGRQRETEDELKPPTKNVTPESQDPSPQDPGPGA